MFWAPNQILDKHAAESDTRRVRECEYRKIRFYAFTVTTYNSDITLILTIEFGSPHIAHGYIQVDRFSSP